MERCRALLHLLLPLIFSSLLLNTGSVHAAKQLLFPSERVDVKYSKLYHQVKLKDVTTALRLKTEAGFKSRRMRAHNVAKVEGRKCFEAVCRVKTHNRESEVSIRKIQR